MDKATEIKNKSEEPVQYIGESVETPNIFRSPVENHGTVNYIVVNPPNTAPVPVINNNNIGGAKFQLNWVFPLVSAIILGGFAALRDFNDKKKIIRYTLFGGFLGSIMGLRIEHEKKYISVFKYLTIIAFPPEKETTTNRLDNNNILSLPSGNNVDTIADHIVMDNSPEVNAEELTKLIESQSLESLGAITPTDTSGDSDSINNDNYNPLAQEPISYIQGGEIIPPFEKEPVEEESIEEEPIEEEPVEEENVSSGPITLIENNDFIDELTTNHNEVTNHSDGDTSSNELDGSTGATKNLPKFFMRPGGIQRKKVRAGNNKKKKNKRKK